MVRDEIVGTYWYVVYNGQRWVTQGNKPVPSGGGFHRSGEGMEWLCLDVPDRVFKDREIVTDMDYMDVDFPDIEPETLVEIEIVKSGKVYVYES